jgi:hypothetical protein
MCVDAFSKWLTAAPMPDQTAAEVISTFVDRIITIHGVPEIAVTDQGTQFMSQAFQELAELYGFRHMPTVPYHPSSNGQVERQNRTLAAILSAYVNQRGDDWDQFTQLAVFAYNSAVHRSTKLSPFFTLHFREPRLPSDLALEIPFSGMANEDFSTFIEEQAAGIRGAWNSVSRSITEAGRKHKASYDDYKSAAVHDFIVGDQVLIFKEPKKMKFHRQWEGPYDIIGITNNGTTITVKRTGNTHFRVHVDKCKLFIPTTALRLHSSDADDTPTRQEPSSSPEEVKLEEEETEEETPIKEEPEIKQEPGLPRQTLLESRRANPRQRRPPAHQRICATTPATNLVCSLMPVTISAAIHCVTINGQKVLIQVRGDLSYNYIEYHAAIGLKLIKANPNAFSAFVHHGVRAGRIYFREHDDMPLPTICAADWTSLAPIEEEIDDSDEEM